MRNLMVSQHIAITGKLNNDMRVDAARLYVAYWLLFLF